MATFRKVGKGWRAEVVRKGVRASKILPTKVSAEVWARAKETEILASKTLPKKSLHEAFTRYADTVSVHKKGQRWERTRIARFKRELPDRPLTTLTPDAIALWRDKRLLAVSTGSVRRDMNLLGAILERATVEWGWIEANPCRKVRKPPDGKPRERIITPEESAAFVAGCRSPVETRVANAFLFALETGMRAGEICGIKHHPVNVRTVLIADTKNGTSREVPLSIEARRILIGLPQSGSVFGLTSGQLDVHFRKVRDRLGFDFTFHSTRHTAATRIALSGKLTPFELCKMFGWKDMNMALRYFNALASDIADRL